MSWLFLVFSISLNLKAQENFIDSSRITPAVMNKSGQLVSVRLVLGEPIKIFVAGAEKAKFDPKTMSIQVHSLNPGSKQTLSVSRKENYFEISEKLNRDSLSELEITTSVSSKSETHKFQIPKTKP